MAITPTDFEKIWSSNATTPAYTFGDADYLEGWDFVGNLPPTRAQWNAIQKRTDEKMKYVFDNFGAPLVAPTVADMTEENRVYVYTGNEVGYTAGDWYYYDEGTSAWVDGGVYNAIAVQTDTTLTQAGEPADAKVVGDVVNGTNLSWNMLPVEYYSGDEYEHKGITFTKNADGSVSSVGTATDSARYYWIYDESFPAGNYLISGIPNDASSQTLAIQYSINGGAYVFITTSTLVTIPANATFSLRTWYKTGYVDNGHTWNISVGQPFGILNPKYNAKNFVAEIYANKTAIATNSTNIATNSTNIAKNTTDIANIESNIAIKPFSTTFVIGSLTSGGAETTSTTRVRSGYIPTQGTTLAIADGYRAYFHYYATNTSTSHSDSSGAWQTTSYTLSTTYPFFRYVVEKVPAVNVPLDEVDIYGNSVGIDVKTQLWTDINNLSQRVGLLENANKLPSYWESYLPTKAQDINSALYNVGNHGDAFIFFTDYHYVQSEYNYLGVCYLPQILEEIKTLCPVQKIVFGGDILTTQSKAEALEQLNKFRTDYTPLGVLPVCGNHEYNVYNIDDTQHLDDDDIYSILYRGMGVEEKTNLGKHMYFSFDNETQKIRYICLNTYTKYSSFAGDTEQLQWFVDSLNGLESGWNVIVIPHIYFNLNDGVLEESSIGTLIRTILDAYVDRASGTVAGITYDFTDGQGTVVCIITGHTHNDGYIMSTKGYPIIGVVTDAMYGSQQNVVRGNSAKGTVSEHAFDVVCIDTDAKTINCVRVGSGSDRVFTYA